MLGLRIMPDAGLMLLIKDNNNNPVLKLNAGIMYQFSTQSIGTKLGVGFCIPIGSKTPSSTN